MVHNVLWSQWLSCPLRRGKLFFKLQMAFAPILRLRVRNTPLINHQPKHTGTLHCCQKTNF
ncbi:hypothetical protein INR49_019908 [Caranx melampygus]|nr:hypothetical protein INR49_019908 [Caranx melampygus]